MSTALAFDPARLPAAPAPLQPVEALQPAVAPAAQPAVLTKPRIAAGAVAVGGLVVVLAGQLLLSIGTADGAYRLAALRAESTSLERRTQVAEEALRAQAAPQRLAARAVAVGLVPDDSPAYLDARDGSVIGDPAPVQGAAKRPGGITR